MTRRCISSSSQISDLSASCGTLRALVQRIFGLVPFHLLLFSHLRLPVTVIVLHCVMAGGGRMRLGQAIYDDMCASPASGFAYRISITWPACLSVRPGVGGIFLHENLMCWTRKGAIKLRYSLIVQRFFFVPFISFPFHNSAVLV
jgi:hypothetical protein